MPNQQDFLHEEMQNIGGVQLLVLDPNDNLWIKFARVSNFSWTMESEKIQQTAYRHGKRRVRQSRTIEERMPFTFTCMEDINPMASQLIYGAGQASETVDQDVTLKVITEKFPLWGTNEMVVTYPHGHIASSAELPAPTCASWTAGTGAAGTLSTDSYYVRMLPGFGTAPSSPPTAGDLANYGITWTVGTASASSGEMAVTGPTGQISVTITAPTSGPAPDFYVAAINDDSDALAGSTFGTVFSAAGAVVIIAEGDQAYSAPVYHTVREITAYNPNSYTAHTETDDYTWSNTEGTVARVADGDIPDGAPCAVSYWYLENPSVTLQLGDASSTASYYQFRAVCLEGDDDDKSAWLGRGDQIDIFRVNLNGTGAGQTYNDDDWHEGATISLEGEYSAAHGRIADKKVVSERFAEWLKYYPNAI